MFVHQLTGCAQLLKLGNSLKELSEWTDMRVITGDVLISYRLVNLITVQDLCLWDMAEKSLFGFHSAARKA